MFIDDAVKKKVDGEERYDKFAVAGTLFGISFNGASCSLLESQVLNSCEHCNLRYMCKKIDEIIDEYTNKTTVITDNFSF